MSMTEQQTKWRLKGKGYEFCDCAPGCTCNFSGLPSSADKSCKAFVGNLIADGSRGEHALAGVKANGITWQKGECVVGSFSAEAEGLDLSFKDSNWIYYEFDWSDDR